MLVSVNEAEIGKGYFFLNFFVIDPNGHTTPTTAVLDGGKWSLTCLPFSRYMMSVARLESWEELVITACQRKDHKEGMIPMKDQDQDETEGCPPGGSPSCW